MPSACDHRVARERLVIATDRRTLYSFDRPSQRMARPINGLATVRLFINDVEVPANHPILGWEILDDEDARQNKQWYKIVFRRVQSTGGWIIEVAYTTNASYCRKCGGTNLVADYQISSAGGWSHVTGLNKLMQRCVKVVLTSICPFYPSMVCALRDRIGKKGGQVFTSDDAAFEVSDVLGKVKSIQQVQSRYQVIDPQETLHSVTKVQASVDPSDPRVMSVAISLTNLAGQTDQVDLGLSKG